MTDIDLSDLRQFVQDLGRIPGRAVDEVDKATKKGAQNIKEGWARRWTGHPRFRALPASISYDMQYGLGQIGAEIGPDKDRRQGALGNIIEFGTSKNAPIPGGMPALAEEEPNYERALMEALTKLME